MSTDRLPATNSGQETCGQLTQVLGMDLTHCGEPSGHAGRCVPGPRRSAYPSPQQSPAQERDDTVETVRLALGLPEPAQEPLVGSGWHGADPCGGPVCPYPECTADAPPSEADSAGEVGRAVAASQAECDIAEVLHRDGALTWSQSLEKAADVLAHLAASPGVQGGEGS